MGCPSCGAENRPGRRFCGACGTALSAACPSCAFVNEPDEKFCGGCGRQMASPAVETPQTASGQATPAPQSYTPRHLAEKILAGHDALQGERKQITVLFADVVGSTELVRDRDPEEAQRLLDGAVQQMMTAVHRYDGTVSRLQGDGLMAMFGAPVANEDHAVRACYAALAMLESVCGYAQEARRTHGAAIQIRVGINSGEVIVRLISDDLHMDYTAMGQTVHLASRLEGLANAGTVLLSPSTLALAEGLIDVRPLGPTMVKGLEQPVAVFELIGAGSARTRLQAAAARGLTPFVGRREERAGIDRALVKAREGHGQVVSLVAEAGVGKSRLVWETIHSDHASGFTVLQTGAVSYGQTTTWLPVNDLLRHYFQIESRDDHATIQEKIVMGVQALDPGLDLNLPALLSLLDMPVDDDAWAALDPPRRRVATLDALRRLVLRESQERPLLLIIEDLHWIDGETQALLDNLVEALPTARILLLVNYRPEYTHTWGNKSYYTHLPIAPLGQANANELLDGALGDDPTVQPLKDLLISRTEGNPFFLEESVRALAETGALVGERGAYRLTGPVENIRVPATVQAVLAARIDRLPPEVKRLLQTASVIGKDVPFTLLQAISDVPDGDLRAGLSRLQAAELLYAVNLYPEAEYTFKHALTHEMAYGGLLQERRRVLHARIVEAIERLYPDRLDEHIERLAYHAVRAEVWEKAVANCRRAGHRALGRSVPREAGGWFEEALAALQYLPESRETLEQAIDVRIEIRNAPNRVDYLERAYRSLVEAEAYAERLGDRRRLGRVLVSMNSYLGFGDNLGRAFTASRRALAIGEEIGDLLLQAAAHFALGQDCHTSGNYPGAIAHFQQSLACLAREGSARPQLLGSSFPLVLHSRCCIAWSLAEQGQFAEALQYGQESVRVADDLGQIGGRLQSRLYLGMVLNRRGEFRQALPLLERAYELMELANLQITTGFNGLTGSLGTALLHVGRVSEAVSFLEQCRVRSIDQGAISDLFIGTPALVEAHLMVGKQNTALAVAHEAVTFTSVQGKRGFGGWAIYALAEVEARRDPPDRAAAEHHYQEALDLAEELEMRPLQARCHLGLGTLYRRGGRLDQARAELSMAVAMLREMGMAFWLPEAERELAGASA